MKGIAGKILFVNLTTGKVSIEIIEDDIYRKYLGGRASVQNYCMTIANRE